MAASRNKVAREKATANLLTNLLPNATFVRPPPESLQCLLCKKLLNNPLQLSCGHRMCKTCCDTIPASDGSKYCPEDSELIERAFPDNSALREIMSLSCLCVSQSEGCTWEGQVLQLEEHVTRCEYSETSQCPYKHFHCTFTGGKLKMEKHLLDSPKKHNSLVATSLKELTDSFQENQAGMKELRKKGEGVQEAFTESKGKTQALEETLNETSALINSEDLNCNNLKEKLDKLDVMLHSSEKKKGEFIEFQNKFTELTKSIETQMQFVNDRQSNKVGGKEKSVADTKKTLVEKVKRLGDNNSGHETQLADLGIKIRIFQCSSFDGNYTWKLDNLRNRFNEALAGKVDELYTPPLYTSTSGYKYSAKVMLYGAKEEKGKNAKFLSFFIVIMQGDYDEILQFPFPYPISVTLINTSKKADITHTLYPDPNKAHFQKPTRNMNPAIGFSRFCSHDRLYTDGFVKNDAIYFRIHVNKTGIDVREPNI